MKTVSISEAERNLAALLDSVDTQDVFIQRPGGRSAVLMSHDQYRLLKAATLEKIADEISDYAKSQGMTEEVLAELLADE
jgi:prevent-host-death family protein